MIGQRLAGASVPVGKWVDCFEPGVNESKKANFRLQGAVYDLGDGSRLIMEEFQLPANAFRVRPDKAADAHWLKA